jgi:hypothetical protein
MILLVFRNVFVAVMVADEMYYMNEHGVKNYVKMIMLKSLQSVGMWLKIVVGLIIILEVRLLEHVLKDNW